MNKKTIKKSNAKFAKATPAQKRVLIAKDVIAAIKAKTINPAEGVWCARSDGKSLYNETQGGEQLSKLIGKNVQCDVCALGALFVCTVRRFNNLEAGIVSNYQVSDIYEIDSYLYDFFSREQIRLIEIAFEGGRGAMIADSPLDNKVAAIFSSRGLTTAREVEEYTELDADEKLLIIMKNIIKNNGKFVPRDLINKNV